MKIGILTLPPSINYGGILQAFALQKALLKEGYDVTLIDKRFRVSNYKYLKLKIKYILFSILRKDISLIIKSEKEANIISKDTRKFINKYIIKTDPIFSPKELYANKNFDAYIVGSDQVWRPIYVDNIYNYYLDFTSKDINIKRISYAASFGTAEWEYSKEETNKCKDLISNFDAISCREASGVDLCQNKFQAEAKHVLDPTFLLSKEDYLSSIDFASFDVPKYNLFSYILDITEAKKDLMCRLSKELDTPIYNLALNSRNSSGNITPTPSVEYWINGIYNSKMVITDSFHGTVFAIIFNKPFISVVNTDRGAARFESLFEMLDIKGNIVKDASLVDIEQLMINSQSINWEKVNRRLSELKQESLDFLNKALNK